MSKSTELRRWFDISPPKHFHLFGSSIELPVMHLLRPPFSLEHLVSVHLYGELEQPAGLVCIETGQGQPEHIAVNTSTVLRISSIEMFPTSVMTLANEDSVTRYLQHSHII